jgi:O-glycosyl hydrolase
MSKRWLESIALASAIIGLGCSSSSSNGGGAGDSNASSSVSSGGQSGSSSSAGGSSSSSKSSSGGSSATGGSSSETVSSSVGGSSNGGGKGGGGGNGGNGGKAGGGGGGNGGKAGAGGTSSGGGDEGGSTDTGTTSGSGGKGGGAGGTGGKGGTTGTGTAGATGTGGGAAGTTGGKGDVTVQLDKPHQTIQGFGFNTALADGKSWPISTAFSTSGADGIGLSILRIGMNTDGTASGFGQSDAKAAGAKIIGSCWSAPQECKSNKSTDNGGYLLDSCYDSWASKIGSFAKSQNLYAMSVGNESDFASCPGNPVCTTAYATMTYTANQMVKWVKVAGKAIKAASPTTKVIAPEASEWIHVWSNLSGTGSTVASHPDSSDPHGCGCFSNTITKEAEAKCASKCASGDGYDYGHWLWKDQDAWKSFDILGLHEYDSQIAFAWPSDVNEGKRDKEVWQTEMSGVMHWPEQGPSTDINNGVVVAGWIHSALTVGEASAWLYWWYQALYDDDNEGLALTKSGGTKAKRYYTMGNYSKFVRPGYVAVEAGNASTDVLISAYKSADDKTVVVVAINKGSGAASPKIGFAGGTAPTSCTPTVTSASDNLKDGTAVDVKDGVLEASLASKTVTTYVCK